MLPLQDTVDMGDPVEAIMPALVNPGGRSDMPLIFAHVDDLRAMAEHLAAYGLRHDPALQRVWFRPPREGASMLEAMSGQWVEGPEPGTPPPGLTEKPGAEAAAADAAVAALTDDQRAALLAALTREEKR